MVNSNILEDGQVTFEDIMCQKDPFNAECRAYGRLKETGREDLAVKCHGYIFLDPENERSLAQLGVDQWNRSKADKNRPIRGIVKDLVPQDKPPFTFKMLPKMRRDVLALNDLGIVVWDLRADNYADGKVLDFSQACTAPHMQLGWNAGAVPEFVVQQTCNQDMVCFDDMVAVWNQEHPGQVFWSSFFPSRFFGSRLRNSDRYRAGPHNQEGARFTAAAYDWRKPAKTVDAGTRPGPKVLKPKGDSKVRKRSSGTAAKRSKGKAKARS